MRIWPGEAVGPEETACGAGSDAAETGPATTRRRAAQRCARGFDGLRSGSMPACPARRASMRAAQARPIALGEIELAAEVEQGDLADLFAGAFGDGETEREVGFAIGFIPGRGFADEHGWGIGGAGVGVNRPLIILWHYNRFPKLSAGNPGVSGSSVTVCGKKSVKDGLRDWPPAEETTPAQEQG